MFACHANVKSVWRIFAFFEFEIETHTRHTIIARRQDWRACFVCQNPHNTVLPNNSTPLAQLQNRKFSFFRHTTELYRLLTLGRFVLALVPRITHNHRHTDWLVGWLVGWLVVWLKTMRPNHWIRHLLHTRNPPSCTVFASRINRQNYWVLRFSVTHDNRTDFYSLYIYK